MEGLRPFGVCTVLLLVLAAYAPGAAAAPVEGNLSWEECAALALANHPELVSAREKVKQAKADEGVTRSGLLPQVSAVMDINRSRQETGTIQGYQEGTAYSYGLSGRQLLFDGGRAMFETAGAKKIVWQSMYEVTAVSSAVRQNLRSAYVSLVQAQESVRISLEIAERRKKNLELVRMRYDAGREHRGSLLTAEVSLAQALSDLAQAERAVSLARHRLAKEMGLNEWRGFSVKDELPLPEGKATPPAYAELADAVPRVKQAGLEKEYAALMKNAVKSDYLPQMYGVASAGKNDSSWPPENTRWSVGVEITLPLLQGGKRVHANSRADAVYRRAVADEKKARSEAMVELEERWVALQNAVGAFRVKEKNLRAAAERARIAEAQYSIGQIFFDNWIIIENALADAKRSYLQARADMLIAEAQWNKSRGVTLEHDR